MNEGHTIFKTLVEYLLRKFLKLDFQGLNLGAVLIAISVANKIDALIGWIIDGSVLNKIR